MKCVKSFTFTSIPRFSYLDITLFSMSSINFANLYLSSEICFFISFEKVPFLPKSALNLDRYSVNAASLLSIKRREEIASKAADSSVPEMIENEETSFLIISLSPNASKSSVCACLFASLNFFPDDTRFLIRAYFK